MYYVYEWYVKETNEVIYVGKGTRNRYKVKKHNRFFDDFIKRYECDSRIIKEFETEQEAFEYEYETVEKYKKIGQCVCNIYKGGTGGTTQWWNENLRKQYSENNVMKSQKQRERMSKENPMKNKEISKRVHDMAKRKIHIGNKTYDGIVDAAREYGVYDTAIQYWLERGYSRDLKPCYYDGEPIPEVIVREGNCNRRAVILDGVRYRSLKEAGDSIGVTNSAIYYAIRNHTKCKGHTVEYDNQ